MLLSLLSSILISSYTHVQQPTIANPSIPWISPESILTDFTIITVSVVLASFTDGNIHTRAMTITLASWGCTSQYHWQLKRISTNTHTWTDFKKPPFMHFFITVSHTKAGVPGSREATFTALTKTCVRLIITPTTVRIILTVTTCLVAATIARTVGSPWHPTKALTMDIVEGIDTTRNTVIERGTPQTIASCTFCARRGLETGGTGTSRPSHIPFCVYMYINKRYYINIKLMKQEEH